MIRELKWTAANRATGIVSVEYDAGSVFRTLSRRRTLPL